MIVLLQVLAFVILFLEIFIPSMGILTILASVLLIWSWTEAAELYPQYVWYIVIADLVLAPIIAWYAFKSLKTSSVTNAIELTDQDGFQSPHLTNNLEKGCQGIVHSDLRPIGEIIIDGRIYEATSRGEWIPKGKEVTIISIQSGKLTVG